MAPVSREGDEPRARSRWKSGVRKFFCGPESFTPDLQPVVGEAPELKNYFVAAGLNSIGILTGGGMGRVLAHWIMNGRPDVDVTGDEYRPPAYLPVESGVPARRARSNRWAWSIRRHYPTRSMQTARGAKKSPIHERLAAQRAYFKDVTGWEGADWYAPEGDEPEVEQAVLGAPELVPATGRRSTRPCREGVILMDMSLHVQVPRAGPRRRQGAQPHLREQRRRRRPG